MSQRSQRLLDLQRLDGETARLQGLLKQAEGALGDRMQERAAAYAVRQAEAALQTRQSEQRDREFELATLETRIKDHEARLYSGKGSPRDLQALQQDIARDRTRQGTLEEQVLAAMDAAEAARREAERIKAAAQRVLGDAATRGQQIESQRAQLQEQLAAVTARRAAAAAALPPADAALYERLRARMPDGVAVAPVIQGRCEGCRTALPSAEVQHARRAEDLVQCSRCGRILHVPVG
jgi:predicted  nucleic acid-binding Zn-ribbon protein